MYDEYIKSTNCPNCGSFVKEYDDDNYLKVCQDCGQIYCKHCGNVSCPNCGSYRTGYMSVSGLNWKKEDGEIVNGKDKETLKSIDEFNRKKAAEERKRRFIEDFLNQELDSNGCLRLTDAHISRNIFQEAFFAPNYRIKKVIISADIATIPKYFFYFCSNIQSVEITGNVKVIGESAFSICYNIERLTLPKGLKKIESSAFSACAGLKQITLPEGLEVIGERAFNDCKNLEMVNLPLSLKKIGENAFSGCNKLKSLIVPSHTVVDKKFSYDDDSKKNTVKLINLDEKLRIEEAKKFLNNVLDSHGCLRLTNEHREIFKEKFFSTSTQIEEVIISADANIPEGFFSECSNLKIVKITGQTVVIGKNAFSGCADLTEINLPNSLEVVGENSFARCKGLKTLELPDKVRVVSDNAFAGCSNLERITLPDSLTEIGFCAFRDCKKLESLLIMPTVNVHKLFADKLGKNKITLIDKTTGNKIIPNFRRDNAKDNARFENMRDEKVKKIVSWVIGIVLLLVVGGIIYGVMKYGIASLLVVGVVIYVVVKFIKNIFN